MSGVRGVEVSIFDCACGAKFEGTIPKVTALKRMHLKICDIGKNVPTLGEGEIIKPRVNTNSNIVKDLNTDMHQLGIKLNVENK